MSEPDLELKNINEYTGTYGYYTVMNTLVTDGVNYLMRNGYSWLVTDALAVIVSRPQLKNAEFLAIHLRLKPNKRAELTIEDGNDKVFYRQRYSYTDARRELTLFYEHGVLLLASEH